MFIPQYSYLTTARKRQINHPTTNQEKYEQLKQKNASIETLKNAFDLDIPL